MGQKLLQMRSPLLLLVLAVYLLWQHFVPQTSGGHAGPLILFLLAIAFSGTRLQILRIRGILSLSDLFTVGVITSLAILPAAGVAAAAAALRHRLAKKGPQSVWEYAVRSGSALVGALGACFLFAYLSKEGAEELQPLLAASALFLLVCGFAETLAERPAYWKKAFVGKFLASAAMAIIFAPAAALLSFAFAARHESWFWAMLPIAILAYVIGEWWVGPFYEDLLDRDHRDSIYLRSVEALALAVDAKDTVSSGHLKRVQFYCTEIAKALNCTDREIRTLEFGALLHDIGKIAVPENLLTKPGRLSPEEFKQVASHAEIGAEILGAVDFPFPVEDLVRAHHENWEGTGYPRGLKGEEIPLTARILSVVDTFDALTSERPYRQAMTVPEALEFIRSRAGKTYDPQVAETLIELLPRLEAEIRKNPRTSRRSARNLSQIKNHREINAVQTSLTHEERIESLKQSRDVARESAQEDDFSSWDRLLTTLSAGLPSQELLDFLLITVGTRIPFDCCLVFLANRAGLGEIYRAGRSEIGGTGLQLSIDSSPTSWVVIHGETLINGNPAVETAGLEKLAQKYGVRSSLIVPLWDSGKVVGTMNLLSKHQGAYNSEYAGLMERLTRKLGSALRRATLLGGEGAPKVDAVTHLPTARQTLRHLRATVLKAQKNRGSVSVFFIDIDHFHLVNDRFGFEEGNRVLSRIARQLEQVLTRATFLGRLGEDRFVAILENHRAERLADLKTRVQQELRETCSPRQGGGAAPLEVSVGAATFPPNIQSPEELLVVSCQRAYTEKINRHSDLLKFSVGRAVSAAPAAAKSERTESAVVGSRGPR